MVVEHDAKYQQSRRARRGQASAIFPNCEYTPQSGRRVRSEGEQRSPEQRESLDRGVVIVMLTPLAPDDGDHLRGRMDVDVLAKEPLAMKAPAWMPVGPCGSAYHW
jgi:hypothetical protein